MEKNTDILKQIQEVAKFIYEGKDSPISRWFVSPELYKILDKEGMIIHKGDENDLDGKMKEY